MKLSKEKIAQIKILLEAGVGRAEIVKLTGIKIGQLSTVAIVLGFNRYQSGK